MSLSSTFFCRHQILLLGSIKLFHTNAANEQLSPEREVNSDGYVLLLLLLLSLLLLLLLLLLLSFL